MIPTDSRPVRRSRLSDRVRFRNWHIAQKLLVVILVLSLVPLLIATSLSTRMSADALTGQMSVSLSRLANAVALRVSQSLTNDRQAMAVLAADPQVVAYLRTSDASQRAALQGNLDTTVKNLAAAAPSIDVIGIYDRNGVTVAHTDPATVGKNVSARDFIHAALTGQDFTSNYRRDPVNDSPGISISAPVEDSSGIIGAVAMHIRGQAIDDLLAETVRSEDSGISPEQRGVIDVLLIDSHGIVMSRLGAPDWLYRVLGSGAGQALQDVSTTTPLGLECPSGAATCPADQKTPRTPQGIPAAQPLADELLASFRAGRSGSYRYCSPGNLDAALQAGPCQGGQHILGYAPIGNPSATAQGAPATLLMVGVDLPEAAFLQPVARQQQRGLLIAGIVGLLAIAASLATAGALARPVRKLAQTAAGVERGEPFSPAQLGGVTSLGDEIGHLARVFSAMVVALGKRMAELQTIYNVAHTITSSVDLDKTLAFIVDSVRDVIPFDGAEICLYDNLQGRMVARVVADQKTTRGAETAYDDDDLVSRLSDSGAGLLIPDLDKDGQKPSPTERSWHALPPRAYLGVPLRSGSSVIGTIELVSRNPSGFSADNLRILESIAPQATVALQNAQEVQAREARLKQQIQALNIEIDEMRREREVKEIVETEYFQKLRQQAAQLRSAKSGEDKPP